MMWARKRGRFEDTREERLEEPLSGRYTVPSSASRVPTGERPVSGSARRSQEDRGLGHCALRRGQISDGDASAATPPAGPAVVAGDSRVASAGGERPAPVASCR